MTSYYIVIGAIIAGCCTILAAVYSSRRQKEMSDDRKVHETQLQAAGPRQERRTKLYPKGFQITEKLSKRFILAADVPVNKAYTDKIKDELIAWQTECGAVFEKGTVKAFRALLASLDADSKPDGTLSRNARNEIWRKKNWFRGCISAEISGNAPEPS